MPITFTCTCGQGYSVPDAYGGFAGDCPQCGARFMVPSPAMNYAELLKEETPNYEELRKEHLHCERDLKLIGLMFWISAALSLLFAALVIPMATTQDKMAGSVVAIVVFLVWGTTSLLVGKWCRALNSKAVIPATILAALGLLGFPIGTIMSVVILYTIHSKKGQYVFSPEYQQVIAATPQLRPKTPVVILIFGGLVVLLLVLGLIAFVVEGTGGG